jgi:tetratricopeptide (TPR) repeat protein
MAEQILATPADPTVLAEATVVQANAIAELGDPAQASNVLQAARSREKDAGRPGSAATLSMAEAELQLASGEPQSVITTLTDAANDFGAAGDPSKQVRAQLQLASAYAMTQQPQVARQILDDCLAEAQQLADPALLAEVQQQEGSLQLGRGELEAAMGSFERGLQAADLSDDGAHRIQLRVSLAFVLASSDPARSATLMSEAESLARSQTDPLAGASGLATVAQGWRSAGRVEETLRCGDEALDRFRAAEAWPLLVSTGLALADVCAAAGRSDYGSRYVDTAVATARQIGGPAAEATALSTLGQYAIGRGDRQGGLNAFETAAGRLQRAGIPVPAQLSAAIAELRRAP